MQPLHALDHRHSYRIALIPLYVGAMVVVLAALALVVLKIDRVVVGRGVLAPPMSTVKLAAARSGEVVELLVREGDTVQAGDVILRMDDREDRSAIESLTAQLQVAELELARRAKLIASRQDLTVVNVEVLRREREAESLAIAPLKADAERSDRDLTRLEKELAKKQTLAAKRVVMESELDAAIAAREKSQTERLHLDAQVSQKELAIETLRQKSEGLELEASIAQAADELAALEARRTIAALRRQLTEARLKLERAEVRAPVAGIVHALSVKAPGESLRAEAVVCRLVPPDAGMVAEIELPAADIGFVHVDQPVKVKLDAFPFEDYGAFTGIVEYVAPDAEPESPDNRKRRPAYTVRVRFSEPELRSPRGKPLELRPGMTLAAELVNRRETLGAVLFRPMRAAGAELGLD